MPFSDLSVLLTHFTATVFMVGVIWTIQLVHYPLFVYADRGQFTPFHTEHSRRITWIVGVGMGAELLSALGLAFSTPERVSRLLALIAFGILLVVHAATVLLSIPSHNTLGRGWDDVAHRRLVSTNWVRTIGWTIRGALALALVAQYASPSTNSAVLRSDRQYESAWCEPGETMTLALRYCELRSAIDSFPSRSAAMPRSA